MKDTLKTIAKKLLSEIEAERDPIHRSALIADFKNFVEAIKLTLPAAGNDFASLTWLFD